MKNGCSSVAETLQSSQGISLPCSRWRHRSKGSNSTHTSSRTTIVSAARLPHDANVHAAPSARLRGSNLPRALEFPAGATMPRESDKPNFVFYKCELKCPQGDLDFPVQAPPHGGGEREEASLRVQAAGSGWVKVGLTFLPHGPPAAALIFRFRDAQRSPTWGCLLAREHAWCTNNDKNDDSVRFRSAF